MEKAYQIKFKKSKGKYENKIHEKGEGKKFTKQGLKESKGKYKEMKGERRWKKTVYQIQLIKRGKGKYKGAKAHWCPTLQRIKGEGEEEIDTTRLFPGFTEYSQYYVIRMKRNPKRCPSTI